MRRTHTMCDQCRNDRLIRALLVPILAALPAARLAGSGGSNLDQYGGSACLAGKLERAATSKAFDEDTGRDLRNFPPDRIVDYEHMTLRLRFEDLDYRRFEATEVLRFVPIAEPATAITLDAVGLQISSVMLSGEPVEHFYDDETLTLRFDPPLLPGAPQELVIEYACAEPYTGMVFTLSSPDAPHYTPEVHTQGQTETNRHWFACHDFPNERLTTELIVDVPSGLAVSGNGRLLATSDDGQRAVWHYLQDKPHVNYLVSMVIGTYDMVEIPHSRVPMHVWVPRGLGDRVMPSYGRTGEMIDVFEERFGVPYPWDRYDQIVVKNFGAGGMENTSATTMYATAILDEVAIRDRDLEGLIAHELAHQWMGDLITCKSWAHIWLNEGGATYGGALWFEHRDGEDGYLDSIRRGFAVAKRDKTTNELPMVSPVWEHAWENFRRKANPYPKGASIFHMLRMMLGDDVFFAGIKLYMERHSLGVVETDDLRYAMEDVSGRGLEWFFEQWCYRPGTPQLCVDVAYDGRSRDLSVDVEQTQPIDERTPAFRFMLPVYVQTEEQGETFEIDVRDTSTSFRTTLDGPPRIVAVDPHLHVLKTVTVNKPLHLWTSQATEGPTIAARHAALEALGEIDSSETIALLADIITDESLRYTLRRTAVRTLAKYGSKPARARLLEIVQQGVDEPRVRVTLVQQLKDFDAQTAAPILAEIAGSDPSYATRVAAIKALADHEATEHADLMAELVHFKSQHDDVRRAALKALAELDDPRGLDLGIQYSAYGYMDRARPAAIETIGKLAHHDSDRAVPYLITLLDDPERRTVRAAGAALAEAGDDRGRQPLAAMSESHPDPRMRKDAAEWLEKLEAAK